MNTLFETEGFKILEDSVALYFQFKKNETTEVGGSIYKHLLTPLGFEALATAIRHKFDK